VNGRCPANARLQPEDVVVADSAYGTYVDLVLAAKADAVFVNIMRVTAIFVGAKVRNWRPYRHSVPNDVLSRWLQMNEFQALDTVHVREVHLLIRQSGFRPKQIILVTTLLDLNAILKQNFSSIICKRRKSISSTSKPR